MVDLPSFAKKDEDPALVAIRENHKDADAMRELLKGANMEPSAIQNAVAATPFASAMDRLAPAERKAVHDLNVGRASSMQAALGKQGETWTPEQRETYLREQNDLYAANPEAVAQIVARERQNAAQQRQTLSDALVQAVHGKGPEGIAQLSQSLAANPYMDRLHGERPTPATAAAAIQQTSYVDLANQRDPSAGRVKS